MKGFNDKGFRMTPFVLSTNEILLHQNDAYDKDWLNSADVSSNTLFYYLRI